MYEFLQHVIVYTGGILAILFWLIAISLFLVEAFDRITGADKRNQARQNEEDF